MTHLFAIPLSFARKTSRRLLKTILVIFAGLALVACEKDTADDSSMAPRCAHDVLEPDLQSAALVGPAVDATGALKLTSGESYVVSSTYGVPKPGSDGSPVTPQYSRIFPAIEAQLETQPGLLALQLSQSDACRSGRTLAVWKSEQEMYAFVTSPAHLEAMAAAGDILQPGYAVTHWEASSSEQMTLTEAVRQLAKVAIAR